MIKLENITTNQILAGVESGKIVRVVSVEKLGEHAVTLYYKDSEGRLSERMLFRNDEPAISLAESECPWGFDAPAEEFKLAVEAQRITLAHLFDPMMAVHTSNVDPLPHQITAVYEAMLPRQPLRYVLADDPGAGKTIMAGLFIRELIMRSDAQRIMIVCPGGLVEQWQDELLEKFGLTFNIFTKDMLDTSHSGNPFDDHDHLIARMDQLSRNEELREKLKTSSWDLIIVDEAHKLSASYFGNQVKKTKRFQLGELLSTRARHFLLMTATPHNGKEEDFQLFMSLLDGDRFYGKFRDGAHKVDVDDMMRRMVKEDLLKFDGTPLFPERRAYTAGYTLSDIEADLYTAVTDYVKNEMNKADALDNRRKGNIGFALTILQRRLASSPEAIYQSLKRRRKRLERRVEEEKMQQRGDYIAETLEPYTSEELDDIEDQLSDTEYEEFTDKLVDQATTAQTIEELLSEIHILKDLESKARNVVLSGQDRKWEELSSILQDSELMFDAQGNRRKLIIFTEHKDTLNYLHQRITALIGDPGCLACIHGGVGRDQRRKIQEMFRFDQDTLVLLATDAAGEGVNLQNANLMVNYDLPWNPNRIEQRFGRIHRIGQTEVCHLWNMVAMDTREGDVFSRLFDKLEVEREALGGRVFDILGEVFEGRALKDMLIEAIRYGDDPEVRARLEKQVEGVLNTEHLKEIMNRSALAEEIMSQERLFAVKEEMEKAEARKLQPYFIRAFFMEAFKSLNGDLRQREAGRYEIPHVPAAIRQRDRIIGSRDPVLKKYQRICFERDHVSLYGKPMASLVHPGHPLMNSVTDIVLESHRNKLKQGTIFVDPADSGADPRVLIMIDHSVRESSYARNERSVCSRRIQFVSIDAHGRVALAGWAPHLDLEPLKPEDRVLIKDIMEQHWLCKSLEDQAMAFAAARLVPEHFEEVRQRRETQVDKTLNAVHERLVKEINYWQDRYFHLRDAMEAGNQPRMQPENARRMAEELRSRLEHRTKELQARRKVISSPPVVLGGALIVPAGLLALRKGEQASTFSQDPVRRSRIEQLAMQAVFEAEHARGYTTRDVSMDKCGWDISSYKQGAPDRHIEVKGRAKGQTTITVTRNEIMYALNQQDKFILAIVFVDEDDQVEGPYYVQNPFSVEPDWGVASVNYDVRELLK
ncbi:helicase-related protein [Desulfonatronovibrio magnus]|uniref:helicase-related protein n=1 Tax=Desulfonatronovibrio magnus TaxID=698827 RepID=UPI0005EBC261|nr:helicase-related protein [Desulfonatronovibrio magnus]